MRKQQFAISTVATMLNLLIQFSLSFFLTSFLVESVGETAYGFFSMSNAIVNYALIVTNALNSMAARYIGVKVHSNDWEGARRYFSSVFLGDLLFSILLLVPACVGIYHLEKIINIPYELVSEVKFLFALVFLNMCTNVVGSVFGCVYIIKDRLDLLSGLQIVSNVVKAILLIILYSCFQPSIVFLGGATLCATLVLLSGKLVFNRKLLPELKINMRSAQFSAVKEIMLSGVWNSFNQLSITLLNGLDLLVANLMVSAEAMGLLSIANTLPGVISTCISSLANLFTPRFLAHYARQDYQELEKECKNSIRFMTVISCMPISFLIAFGVPFFQLWTPSADTMSLYWLSLLVLMPQFTGGCINSLNYLYTVVNKVKWQAIVLFFAGISNVVVVFVLLKLTNLGIYAIAGVSAVLGFVRNFCFNAPYAAHCIKRPVHIFWLDMFRSMLCLLLCAAIGLWINHMIILDSWLKLILVGGGTTLLSGGVVICLLMPQKVKVVVSKLMKRS